jgi:hypothetical protein
MVVAMNRDGKEYKGMRLSWTIFAWMTVALPAFPVVADETTSPDAAAVVPTDASAAAVTAPSAEQPSTQSSSQTKAAPAATQVSKSEAAAPARKDTAAQQSNETAASGSKGAEEESLKKASAPPPRLTLGLSPGAPDLASLPGGVTPAFGSRDETSKDWRFEFHGLVYLPLRIGINQRENPGSDQKTTVLHAPPRVPGDFETFGYTSMVPEPWNQLNFTYGNNTVSATVIIAARTVTSANGYFDPPDMMGINDAFLTFYVPLKSDTFKLQMNFGAFANRYGYMGEYDLGRFGTPLIARVSGTGLTATGTLKMNDITMMMEAGFQGQFNKAPVGVEPAGWNGFADPNIGSGYAGHGHLSLNYRGKVELGGHIIDAFTKDDRASNQADIPKGSILVAGADLRFTTGRFGHLYMGYGYTKAETARSVSSVIRVLNAPGGPGLMNEYLGQDSEGTGKLNTVGFQYDLSLGNLLRYPNYFEGDGPDVIISAFGILTHVTSPNDNAFDDVNKLKLGGELGYSALKWLALGFRYDHVMPDVGEGDTYHSITTGRIIFHSDWNSRDQVVLQYSYFNCGSASVVREGYPPMDDPTIVPDSHVLSLTATLWW